jgi:hypothetical protein
VLAFISDGHYARALAAAICSVIANLDRKRQLQVFIVDAGIAWSAKEKILQLERSPVPEHCQRLFVAWQNGHANLLMRA